jgi:uncharacterized protein (TIGR02246 family)
MKMQLAVAVGLVLAIGLLVAEASAPPANPPNKPAAAPPPSRDERGAAPADDQAIRATITAFEEAFPKHDARAIAALFAEEGEAIDADGRTIQGRPALEQHYTARFKAGVPAKIVTTIDSVRLLAPGVARVTGRTRITLEGTEAPATGRFTAIEVKRDGRWLLASVRELADLERTHHDHLTELGWLVGDWVEETAEAVVLNSVAWTEDGNFLIRSFDVRVKGQPVLKGVQRIGWDPLTRQIKSWVFDSHGGHGEGLWSRHGDQWAIKSTGVRPDGKVVTATQVLTYISKDTLRWKSLDQTVGTGIEHDVSEIVMVRKPPAAR